MTSTAPPHLPAETVSVEDIVLPASDGFALAASLFKPAGDVRGAVLINSATAVPRKIYRSFASYLAGRGHAVVTYDCEGVTVGCAICYDLRFPDLFQALAAKGAAVIALPAAFTMQTGKDHWEVLCRARAIETETYFCAAGQTGSFRAGNGMRQTYGHSMVVDPWGHVVARASDGVGIVTSRIDPKRVDAVREMIPVARHRVKVG